MSVISHPYLNPFERLQRDRVRLLVGCSLLHDRKRRCSIWTLKKTDFLAAIMPTTVIAVIAWTALALLKMDKVPITPIKTARVLTLFWLANLGRWIFAAYVDASRQMNIRYQFAKTIMDQNIHLFPKNDEGRTIIYHNFETDSEMLYDPKRRGMAQFLINCGPNKKNIDREHLKAIYCLFGHFLYGQIDTHGKIPLAGKNLPKILSFFYTRKPSPEIVNAGKSQMGYAFDRPLLASGSSSVNQGIYFGGELSLVVDETVGPELENLYQKMKKSLPPVEPGHSKEYAILVHIYLTVKGVFPANDEDRVECGGFTPLQKFIQLKRGVCRHKALLAAYLLEKAQLEQLIQGKFFIQDYHQACNSEPEEGHAFIKYVMANGEEVIMDPAKKAFFSMSHIEKEHFNGHCNGDCMDYKKHLRFAEQRRHNLAPLLIKDSGKDWVARGDRMERSLRSSL